MKKLISLLLLLVITPLSLSPCAKEPTKTYQPQLNPNQLITSFTYKHHQLLKQSTIPTIKYHDLPIHKHEPKQIFKNHQQPFKRIH
ncbi:DUF1307 domain-containing protein, partial [Staphylococcus epidermidis]|uniref:DUF1307 domain-containing protein n=1 Tax=Staphylococcus epidermidis TaxID=1282 RepID=UPI0011A281C9